MPAADYFDHLAAAQEAGLTPEQALRLYEATLSEYHGDQMMAELRALRACRAIASGCCTWEQAMQDLSVQEASPQVADTSSSYGDKD